MEQSPKILFGDCLSLDDVLYFKLRILRDIRLLYSDRQSAGELPSLFMNAEFLQNYRLSHIALSGWCSRRFLKIPPFMEVRFMV